VFSLQEKTYFLVHVDTSMETHVAQAARLGSALSTLNITVTKRKDTRKCYASDQ
jgi:hypothetical protein